MLSVVYEKAWKLKRDHLQFQCFIFRHMMNSFCFSEFTSNTMYRLHTATQFICLLCYFLSRFRIVHDIKITIFQIKLIPAKISRIQFAHTSHGGINFHQFMSVNVCILNLIHVMHDNIKIAYQNETVLQFVRARINVYCV